MVSSHSPTANVPPSPRGRGLFELKNYFSLEGEGSLKTIIPHTQGEGTFWEDGFCDLAFGSAQNDRDGSYCSE